MTDLHNTTKTGTSGWNGRRAFNNLSPAEVNEKMRKGECFTCEKYNPTHVCKNKQFRLMIMEQIWLEIYREFGNSDSCKIRKWS